MVAYYRVLPKSRILEIEQELAATSEVKKPLRGWRKNDGYEKGMAAERRFLDICNEFALRKNAPEWFCYATRGDQKDDANGIDIRVWIHVDTHEKISVGVQIKSSRIGVEKFRSKSHWSHIPCIIVNDFRDDNDIRREMMSKISRVRRDLLLARR